MIKFFLFIKKIHFVLAFVVLEAFALHYYANSTSYTKAKLITASNYVVGGIYSQLSGIGSYFRLKRENAALNAELAELRNRLDGLLPSTARDSVLSPADSAVLTDTAGRRKYEYYPAKVVNNSITRQENYITIDRGADDGMRPDMALVAEGGIAGYIVGCSDRFSVCLSVLNRNFRTSGKIKGGDYFGSVYWDGTSYRHLTLSEIPKYAQIHAGDTIVTTAHSSIFPPDLTIGTVESFELNNATYYDVKVRLHTDIAALNNVLAVRYLDADERGASSRRRPNRNGRKPFRSPLPFAHSGKRLSRKQQARAGKRYREASRRNLARPQRTGMQGCLPNEKTTAGNRRKAETGKRANIHRPQEVPSLASSSVGKNTEAGRTGAQAQLL